MSDTGIKPLCPVCYNATDADLRSKPGTFYSMESNCPECAVPATPSHATDTAGLVERLRAATFTKGRIRGGVCGQTIEAAMRSTFHEVSAWDLDEAADALSALRASIDRANAANEALAEDVSALRAENERLTAELTLQTELRDANVRLPFAAVAERDRLQAELARVNQTLTTACILAADELREGETDE